MEERLPDRAGMQGADPGRLRQEVLDTRRRTTIGGLFYLIGWVLIGLYSPLWQWHPVAAWTVAAVFLVLALLRFVKPRFDSVAAQARWLDRMWLVLWLSTGLWGAVSAWVLGDMRFAAVHTATLICTVAFSTAVAHTLSTRLGRSLLCLGLVFLPTLATLWLQAPVGITAWAMLVYGVYLLLALLASHAEYRIRLDLDAELRVQRDRFQVLSRLDGLTGLANRRHFANQLDAEVAQAHVQDAPLTLLILDIDHFKRFNDSFGHVAGDACLTAFARRMREHFAGRGEHLARIGGEEFALLLPRCRGEAAAAVADSFRRSLIDTPLDLAEGADAVRVSVGVAELGLGEAGTALYLLADRALYQAKSEGRNQVQMAAE